MSLYHATSDLHFGHEKCIEFCDRPFKTVTEMNERMIENWNRVVSQRDTTFVLGDLFFGRGCNEEFVIKIVNSLNGKIVLIPGNHDFNFFEIYKKTKIIVEKELFLLTYFHKNIVMCHYPMLRWYRSHKGSYHLFGHVHHNPVDNIGLSMNVGVDVNNFTPLSFIRIFDIMKTKEEMIQKEREEEKMKVDPLICENCYNDTEDCYKHCMFIKKPQHRL